MIKITVALTPGEIVECIHALKSMTRFNNTEQRDSNASAIIALEYAYDQYVATREEQAMNMRSMFRDAYTASMYPQVRASENQEDLKEFTQNNHLIKPE